jgi:hypothetical protein
VGDGAAAPDTAPPKKDAAPQEDASSGFDAAPPFDAGSCGADFLNDPKNCGYCGHDCLGGECHSGKCQAVTLAGGLALPYGIAVVGGAVYFASQGQGAGNPGAIWRASTAADAGLATPIVSQNGPYLLAADAQNLYWTNQQTNSVFRAPLAGGVATEIAPNQNQPSGIAVTATHVYWTTYKGGEVKRTALPGGGAIETLASGQAGPAGLAVDAQYVYFANFDGGTIAKVPIAGGTVVPLAQALQQQPLAVAIDAKSVYWTSYADGRVSSCPLDPGASMDLVAPTAGARGLGILVDGSRLVFSRTFDSFTNTGIYASLLVPGSPTPLAQPTNAYPSVLAQDATAIYFTNFALGGSVMKIAK